MRSCWQTSPTGMGRAPHVFLEHGGLQRLCSAQGVELVDDNLHGILEDQLLKPGFHQLVLPLPQACHHPASIYTY